jgi:hypothetical protein
MKILDVLIAMFCDVAISKETEDKLNIVDVLVEKSLWKSKKKILNEIFLDLIQIRFDFYSFPKRPQ